MKILNQFFHIIYIGIFHVIYVVMSLSMAVVGTWWGFYQNLWLVRVSNNKQLKKKKKPIDLIYIYISCQSQDGTSKWIYIEIFHSYS